MSSKAREQQLPPDSILRNSVDQFTHLYNILLMVRNVGRVVMEAAGEADLTKKTCDALMEARRYKGVWIGSTARGEGEALASAQAGSVDLAAVRLAGDAGDGETLVDVALRTSAPAVVQDVLNDERCSSWGREAVALGVRSAAAVPVKLPGKASAALYVCSGQPDIFDKAEVGALAKVARDLSSGIERLRQRKAMKDSEARYRATLDSMLEGCQIIGSDCRYL
ncbi:MAG: GAF domain-containing protein [Chloroflexi bacterium]|nr:GAF domain-containing protein [Chloroflexota bacterium]